MLAFAEILNDRLEAAWHPALLSPGKRIPCFSGQELGSAAAGLLKKPIAGEV